MADINVLRFEILNNQFSTKVFTEEKDIIKEGLRIRPYIEDEELEESVTTLKQAGIVHARLDYALIEVGAEDMNLFKKLPKESNSMKEVTNKLYHRAINRDKWAMVNYEGDMTVADIMEYIPK